VSCAECSWALPTWCSSRAGATGCWTTNPTDLGDSGAAYTADTLDAALAAHRYDVQAALYLLALHRLLRARLGAAYTPQQHLGGALFWFLRGIDGPQAGLCHLTPPTALLDALDAMLDPAENAA
jgi:exodeoxyribonuclease V beta subunit